MIVFATGFDAMTGAITGGSSDHRPRRQIDRRDVWASGPQTYLGLTVAGFPNLFMVTGPGSPSVLSNMAVSIEQHVDWVVDRLIAMREAGFTTIEATETAQAGWARHMADCTALTLHRLANTWYTGANVPGKAQGVMPYTGGVGPYRSICDEVVSRGMLGFKLTGPNGAEQCNDGEIVRLQPDVRLVLNMLADLNLPPIESLGAQGARDFVAQFNATRPAGRPVGEVVDGTLAGADGPLALPPLSAGDAGPASDRGLFPWRRLGAGRRAVRRSVLPRPVPAHRHDRSSASTTGMRRSIASRRRPRTATRRCAGSPSTRPSWAAGRGRCWSRAGAPAATSLPSPASWRATAAGPRSPASSWSARSPTARSTGLPTTRMRRAIS